MIETKEAGVEPARHTCVRLTGFEVRSCKWNQQLKSYFRAFCGLFPRVGGPKRVPISAGLYVAR